MRNKISQMTMLLFLVAFNYCTVQRDPAVSAQASLEIGKTLASSMTKSTASGSASMQDNASNAASDAPTCITETYKGISGQKCSSSVFETFMGVAFGDFVSMESQLANGQSGKIVGYQKLRQSEIVTADGKKYKMAGSFEINGSIDSKFKKTPPSVFQGQTLPEGVAWDSNTNILVFEGALEVTGADTFSMVYKKFTTTTTFKDAGKGVQPTRSTSCSGAISVNGIDYPIKADCSF